MMRRVLLLIVFSWTCAAQSSYERLAAAAKLWTYVKYCHPGVTAAGVDWDAALAKAAPKILEAKDDAAFSAAVGEMLGVLNDPMTHVISQQEMMAAGSSRFKPVVSEQDGVTVVRYESGTYAEGMQLRNPVTAKLRGKGTVVIDIRDSKGAQYVLPDPLPAVRESIGPAQMMRVHSGYANDANSGSGGYQSYWATHDGARIPAAEAGGMRAIWLVNHETGIPMAALAMQASGAGAIVSEDAIDDGQTNLARPFTVWKGVRALVRTAVLAYADGTTGIAANAVMHAAGGTPLQAAIEMAKSGKWPAASGRPKLDLPPARFMEKAYSDQPYPGRELRMVSAARIWGVFQYFHPYRNLYGEDWDAVLTEFLARMAGAENAREYHLDVAEMVAHVHDTHCFVNSGELAQFYGAASPPLELRWIEEQPVVTRVLDTGVDIHPGDVLTKIDGEPYHKRVDELAKRIAASTMQSMMSRVLGSLLSGPNGSAVRVTVKGENGAQREVPLTRDSKVRFHPYREGDAFRLLNPKTGYVDLEKLTNAQVDAMFDAFRDTEAIIMDMRGYPQGTAWSIAPRLTEEHSPVAAHFERNLVMPDTSEDLGIMKLTFEQRIPGTNKPRYKGKTVMLIDERAISQSEHSGLFYRAANGTKFIGSGTAGANGDVTYFIAPGGIRINFSGHDVRWPDGKQLQRVGLAPDIEVRPTIAGIRAGRDEVLERAMVYLEGGK
jgi:C-terminal processing protease CtpA/Prc